MGSRRRALSVSSEQLVLDSGEDSKTEASFLNVGAKGWAQSGTIYRELKGTDLALKPLKPRESYGIPVAGYLGGEGMSSPLVNTPEVLFPG